MYGGIKDWLLCCVLAVALSSGTWLDSVEEVWHKRRLGYLLAMIAAGVWILFQTHPPPSGYAVTAMAVIAGVMALRGERMIGREKWVWFAILLLFTGTEIRAIRIDRQKDDERFETIAKGLKETLKQENETAAASRKQFEITLNNLEENLRVLMGGDAFAWVNFNDTLQPETNLMTIVPEGKYALHTLRAEILDVQKFQALGEQHPLAGAVNLKNQATISVGPLDIPAQQPKTVGPYNEMKKPKQEFIVNFEALNSFWEQETILEWINGPGRGGLGGHWTRATRVTKETRDARGMRRVKTIFTCIKADFPVRELHWGGSPSQSVVCAPEYRK